MDGYGKIFKQIYDGTLVEHWQALITFQQMIVLCDPSGVIDMTAETLSRRTGIPLSILRAGLQQLESIDEYSLRIAAGATRVSHHGTRWVFEFIEPGRPGAGEWKRVRLVVFQRDDFTCRYCGRRGGDLECDHVVPVSRGGDSDVDNLVTSCGDCNRSKGAKLLAEWR